MFTLDHQIFDYLVNNEADSETIDRETDTADEYRIKWITLKRKVDRLSLRDSQLESETVCSSKYAHSLSQAEYKSVSSCNNIHDSSNHRRNFKLPKLEIKKFDGDVRNWIGFWGQFRKIDEDHCIDDYDKFQYLLQSMEEGTSARGLLYDKLTTQLRALETLGVTSDKYAAMLLPLVESALPEEILRAYERYQMMDSATNDTGKVLTHLLNFIRKEVESNERISIAKSSFVNNSCQKNEPTASCLLSGEGDNKVINRSCIWCDRSTHSSAECSKLNKLAYEDKKAIIKKKKGCAICLRIGHHAKVCKIFIKCLVCSRRHSTVMCPDLNCAEKRKDTKKESDLPDTSAVMYSSQVTKITILQTLIVNIVFGSKKVPVRALIDTGAQRSYIKEEIAKKLGLKPIGEQALSHQLFGGSESKMRKHNVYKICIENLDGSYRLNMTTLDEPKICGSIPSASCDLGQRLEQFNITLTDIGEIKDIGVLIGADFASYIATGTFIQVDQGLVAIKTKLGWTVQGNVAGVYCSTLETDLNAVVLFSKTDVNITDLWDLETIGIHDKPTKITEEETLEYFKETLRVNEEGRYEVALPWKHDQSVLSSNRDLAEKRLVSTTKRLNATDKYVGYDGVFKEWLQLGIIEEVTPDDGYGHYLAHHAVIKESSLTTKIRPVFDASAKGTSEYSLNACLDKGINLIELIPKILTRFRMNAVGISPDIAKAFLQIALLERDRDYLKFLWWRDGNQKEVITYRHCRVVFGLTCSPFLLSGTIKHHLENYHGSLEDTAKQLLECFYTDNCVTSLERKEVSKFVSEAREVMAIGKFDLRSWVTAPLTDSKPERDLVSILGMQWDTVKDLLCCNVGSVNTESEKRVTKRSLLSMAHRLFDPIGFTAPTSLVPKIILQRAWQGSYGWDEELPQNIAEEFRAWMSEIDVLKECKIPRRLTSECIVDCHRSLHVFCDASMVAYATCIFFRSEFEGVVDVSLVLAKARVAPSKQHSHYSTLRVVSSFDWYSTV